MRRCARATPGSVVVVVGEFELLGGIEEFELLGFFRRRTRGQRARRLGRQAEVVEDLSSIVPRMFGCGATVTTTCPFLCPFSTYVWASTISSSG